MNTNTHKHCYNCESPITGKDKFCASCGQKHTTGKIKLSQLIGDFVDEQFNLNNKLLKTLIHAFIPGKLSEQYFLGKHKSYLSPIKFFFITAVLVLTALSLDLFKIDSKFDDISKEITQHNTRLKVLHEMDSLHLIHIDTTKSATVSKVLHQISDSLWHHTRYRQTDSTSVMKNDSIHIPVSISFNSTQKRLPKVKASDFEQLSSKELVEKYMKDDYTSFQQIIVAQVVKVSTSPVKLVKYVIGKLAIAICLMMPFLALFLKLLYLNKNKYYVEHLVFSFHYHSFIFLLNTITSLISLYFNGLEPYLFSVCAITLMIYLLIAVKRIYQQSWLMTSLKISIIGLFYIILLIIFIALTVIVSFILF